MISIIFVLFLISEHGILSCSFRSNIFLSIALWAVLSLFVICLFRDHVWQPQVIVGKTHWSITCFLSEMGSCLSWSISLFVFSKTAPCCCDPGIYFFFCSVFKVCGLSEVFEFCHFFYFLLIYLLEFLHCLHGLSCTLSFLCVFLSQLSYFLSSDCLSVFFICFVVSLKRATSSANLKLVRFSPSTLTPSVMSAFVIVTYLCKCTCNKKISTHMCLKHNRSLQMYL